MLTWEQESFAFADSFDEAAGRYRGLRGGQRDLAGRCGLAGPAGEGGRRPGAARRRERRDSRGRAGSAPCLSQEPHRGQPTGWEQTPPAAPKPAAAQPKRFHGTVTLDAARVGRDAGRIAEEVIAHLTGLVGAKVTVTLEIEAEIPSGAPDHVVRTVTENSRTLKFTSQGFEVE